jgi:putative ABC transport system ATP-binding protein
MNDSLLSGCLLSGLSHLTAPPAAGNGPGDRQPESSAAATDGCGAQSLRRAGSPRAGRLEAGATNPGAADGDATHAATKATPMIALRELTKSVPAGPARVFLLRHISFSIEDGEFVSIMGPSGSGKSTLLHILGMQDFDFEGEYELDGAAVHAMPAKHRAELQRNAIGFVFQSFRLLEDLTVAENLEVPLRYRDIAKPQRERAVADVLEQFRIVAKKDLYPSQLSGGQQQLVAIARAVITSPRILLADEPTGNLHADQAHEIMALFRELHRAGTTIVQVTHSEETAAMGDRVVRLRDGWLIS